MRQSKIIIERPANKLSRDLLALGRKRCMLVTGFLTGDCTLRQNINILSL
jgi:hypothetical protein